MGSGLKGVKLGGWGCAMIVGGEGGFETWVWNLACFKGAGFECTCSGVGICVKLPRAKRHIYNVSLK